MKTNRSSIKMLVICVCVCLSRGVMATTLDVPYYQQVCPEWCWNASAEMVLAYYGFTEGATYEEGQTNIAAYAAASLCVPNYLSGEGNEATKVATWTAGPNCAADEGASAYVPVHGDNLILKHFGDINSTLHGSLTVSELQDEIDGGRPVLIAIGWYDKAGKRLGGHVVVLIGFDGTVVDINDPWPCDGVLHLNYTSLLEGGPGTYVAGAAANVWENSLTTGGALDLVLLIDSTGSMSPEIDSVKAAAQAIIAGTFDTFTGARVAVVDYRDNPDWTGDYGYDYIYNVDIPFTTNVDDAVAAIDPIYAEGGGDIPEAVYSAMYDTLQGTIVGGWRPNPTPHLVIVMSDAGGHDPVEDWDGGHSMDDCIALANTNQIIIDAVACGVGGGDLDPDCVADLGGMAGGTGGSLIEAGSSSGVGLPDAAGAVSNAINQATGEHYPIGSIAAFQPKFSFSLTGIGMGARPKSYSIQILKSNTITGVWSTYLAAKVRTNSYTPTRPLPIGTYRWRIGFKQPASTVLSPSGQILAKIKAAVNYENDYTEFQREDILPGDATIVSPSSYFVASSSTQVYTFDVGVNASSYYIVITDETKGKIFRKLTVKPPKKHPNASPLTFTVKGHTVGHYYVWTIESLNFDHPKP